MITKASSVEAKVTCLHFTKPGEFDFRYYRLHINDELYDQSVMFHADYDLGLGGRFQVPDGEVVSLYLVHPHLCYTKCLIQTYGSGLGLLGLEAFL